MNVMTNLIMLLINRRMAQYLERLPRSR